MRMRAGNRLKKLLGGVLTLSMLLSGLHMSSVQAKEADYISPLSVEKVSDGDGGNNGETLGNAVPMTMANVAGMPKAAEEAGVYTLDATADLTAFSASTGNEGTEQKAGTDNYFTLIYSGKTKVDASTKKFDDGYTGTQRVNFGGKMSTSANAVRFTTSSAATVKIWWAAGDVNRQMAILDSSGTQIAVTKDELAKNAMCISTLEIEEAGTYYLGGDIGSNYIFKVEVTETSGSSEKPPRAGWSTVAPPEISAVALNPDNAGKLDVTVDALVGYDGADKLTVIMLDAQGNTLETKNSSADKSSHTLTFTPSATGVYTFKAVLVREGETDKESGTESFDFTLPLAAPVMKSVTSTGGGTAVVKWNAVPEAEGYIIYATPVGDTAVAATVTASGLEASLAGLTVGQRYTVSVKAVRGTEESPASCMEAGITQEAQREWVFAAYGASTDTKNNGYQGNINDGSVTVFSEGGKGKIQPSSHDGLAFYYTEMDPATENFTLTADIHVDKWTYSNAQEGFGIMAADAVGVHGSSAGFFTNSFQALATKIEYNFDGTAATTAGGTKISMKLGLGYIARQGITAQDFADLKAGTISMPSGFISETGTLETSAGSLGPGTYNLIGNCTNPPSGGLDNLLTDIRLQIQRNNTGYILRYLDQENNVLGEKLFYDLDRNALTQIDGDHIYVGFIASRNARITVTNMTLTTIAPEDDAPAEGRELEYVYPSYTVESATVANSPAYTLVYYGNADGVLTVQDSAGNVVVNGQHVLANTKNAFPATLAEGTNTFTVTFTPDADYRPGEYKLLQSYDTATFTHSVEYASFNAEQKLYVAPDGTPDGDGSKGSPLDIYTAVQYVKPGQYIMLAGGTYNLTRTVKVERGIDGTADNMIYMIADPETEGRPVFDFGGNCAGMILAGDYWYFQGFDVTRSADAQKGIQVSGDYNVLDQINTYKNGNTGIQISRYKGTDEFADWPSYNLILNCTSYLNADKGYEDADGFAAKLTVGEGNVFDGCISAYNADDGWDLFAKVQSGSIGVVTIQNCVAFKNGYVLRAGGGTGDLDLGGVEVNAGNGNGFKMGGDSLSGYHVLINSIAFDNKAKGIDSNSCPDIQVYRSTSFDNESYNVAFYTNNAANTDFYGEGILSFKVSNSVTESFKLKGSQDDSKVHNDTNYFIEGNDMVSRNPSGAQASLDWFVRTDVENAMFLLGEGGRNADGSINMQGLLALTDAAPAGVGARLNGNSLPGTIRKPEQYSSVATEGIPEGSVPAKVLAKVGCGSAKELQELLAKDIMASTEAKQLLGDSVSGTAAFEVEVKVSLDGGRSWMTATEDNFPRNGVDVLLPYPQGTNARDFDFAVSHLVVLGCNGQEPGAIEYLRPRKTNSGLVVHVMSASPFTVGWTQRQQPDDDDDDDNVVTTAENGANGSGKSRSPKTGDTGRGVYDSAALERIVVKVNDVGQRSAETVGEANDKAEPSATDVLVTVAAGAPIAGLMDTGENGYALGWLLAVMAVLLTTGAVGAVVYERKKSGQEDA